MLELASNYGRIDIMWLDGGQVRPQNGQNIRLGEVVEKARKLQPWMLFADRTVGGPYENYITPEQEVPSTPIHVPWESCITMGTSFSFRYDDKITDIALLGSKENLSFKQDANGIEVMLPAVCIQQKAPIAHVFKLFSCS
jgi:alpha-L-fucosidase